MAKDPAFLFYSSDFLVGSSTLDWEERGKYITLLCTIHQKGRLEEKTIRFLVGSVSDNLKSMFSKDENDLWFSKRLEFEIEKRKKFTESRRNNGLKGGRPKKNSKPNKNLVHNLPPPLMENENENENINTSLEKFEKPFLEHYAWEYWKNYKKSEFNFKYKSKIAEKAAISKLRKLSEGNLEKAEAIINQSMENGWKGFFKLDEDKKTNNQSRVENTEERVKSNLTGWEQ